MLLANDTANAGAELTFTNTAPQAGDSLEALLAKLLTVLITNNDLL